MNVGQPTTSANQTPTAKPTPIAQLWRRILAAVRVRRGFHAPSTEQGERQPYYRETSPVRLSHALSKRGPGFKQYRVTFPDGSKMLIHHTNTRIYTDIATTSPHRAACEPALQRLRPGQRVLIIPGGTGDLANAASQRVGPSGAVVSLDTDDESVRYATRRYRRNNIAFEVGKTDSLAGEVNGSFDAVICISPTDQPHNLSSNIDPEEYKRAEFKETEQLTELWRVVADGGWMYVAAIQSQTPTHHTTTPQTQTPLELLIARTDPIADWLDQDEPPPDLTNNIYNSTPPPPPDELDPTRPVRRPAPTSPTPTSPSTPPTNPAIFLDRPEIP